jgi:cytochrome c peroxidase
MRNAGIGLAVTLLLAACSGSGETIAPPPPDAGGLRVPGLGPVPPLPEWKDDPTTDEKVTLGTDMFFDIRLSGSGHTTCDACHGHQVSYQDNLTKAVPDRSYPLDTPKLPRNTPSLYNIVHAPVFRWDGSNTDLVDVMAFPFAEANMNLGADVPSAQVALKKRLTADLPGYVPLFQKAFGQDITALAPPEVWRLAGRALAAFIRKAASRDAAFDRWNAGDDKAMTEGAVRGLGLFQGKGKCVLCHNGPLFTDFAFHNLSVAPLDKNGVRDDDGRYGVTHDEADRGAFLTPTLRSVYNSSPYFHDGSATTLRDVLAHLGSDAVRADPRHDPIFDEAITFTDGDVDDLVEFLGALRGVPVVDAVTQPPPNTP